MSQIEGQRNVEDVTRPILRIRLSDGRMAQIQVRVTVNQEDFIDGRAARRGGEIGMRTYEEIDKELLEISKTGYHTIQGSLMQPIIIELLLDIREVLLKMEARGR